MATDNPEDTGTVADETVDCGTVSPEFPPEPIESGPRYDHLDVVGTGGAGVVWQALDRKLERTVVRKVLRRIHQDSASMRERFLREARLMARLDHPGVVGVHDWGTLPDGRPWICMDRVEGRTLGEVLDDAEAEERWPLRRLVGHVLRVAEVVAYAHEQGVVHRDIKPSNIMLGAHGQVFLMDWGIAMDGRAEVKGAAEAKPGQTQHGTVIGTPGYMAPEQARGAVRDMGPHSDVHALGTVLLKVMTGRTSGDEGSDLQQPDGHDCPRALVRLVRSCRRASAADRPADAGVVVRAIRDWLDGDTRRQQAIEVVRSGAPLLEQVAQCLEDVEGLRALAVSASDLPPWASDAERAEHWELTDRAVSLEREAEVLRARHQGLLHQALQVDPHCAEAHVQLARHHRAAVEWAESAGQWGMVAHHEQRLAEHDRGEHAAFLRREAVLRCPKVDSGTVRRAVRQEERGRRLQDGAEVVLPSGGGEVALEAGSWRVDVQVGEGTSIGIPVSLKRGQVADLPELPEVDWAALGTDCFVMGGPYVSGGDERAMESPPARVVDVASFVIQRHPVRNREFLEFLNALVAEGRTDEALQWCPRARMGSGADADATHGYAWDGRAFELGGPAGQGWRPDEPVVLVTPRAAQAYARWWAERTGLPWRLPFELEWEKAARGVDGRPFPWGHHAEAPWANLLNHSEAPQHRTEVGQFPVDRSIYGVMDLGGNVRDICADAFVRGGAPIEDGRPVFRVAEGDDLHTAKGGSWTSVVNLSRSAVRFVIGRDQRFSSVGFRLARTVAPPD